MFFFSEIYSIQVIPILCYKEAIRSLVVKFQLDVIFEIKLC